jgi:hypothetical protein
MTRTRGLTAILQDRPGRNQDESATKERKGHKGIRQSGFRALRSLAFFGGKRPFWRLILFLAAIQRNLVQSFRWDCNAKAQRSKDAKRNRSAGGTPTEGDRDGGAPLNFSKNTALKRSAATVCNIPLLIGNANAFIFDGMGLGGCILLEILPFSTA